MAWTDFIKDHWDNILWFVGGAGVVVGSHGFEHKNIRGKLKAMQEEIDHKAEACDDMRHDCRRTLDQKLDVMSGQLNRIIGYIEAKNGKTL